MSQQKWYMLCLLLHTSVLDAAFQMFEQPFSGNLSSYALLVSVQQDRH